MNTLELLEKYASPKGEASFAKGIPIKYLKEVREALKLGDTVEAVEKKWTEAGWTYNSFRYVFRGKSKPGFVRPRAWCPKPHAETFAIYERGNYAY
jgi:hypothetical protein|tara:strand:- start:561 stop:848 length:288 start_codon:yes stop_codon:yes gene_type:complete